MSRRRMGSTRRMKRHMMKELGGETFSAKIKRQVKETRQRKEKELCEE